MFGRNLMQALGWLAVLVVAPIAAAASSVRPGAPDAETSWSPGPGDVSVRWRNTAGEGGMVFDIEGQIDAGVTSWRPPSAAGVGSAVTYTFHNLPPGQHCFRIWSRVGPQRRRSGLPSAFTCSVLGAANDGHPATPAPMRCKELACAWRGSPTH